MNMFGEELLLFGLKLFRLSEYSAHISLKYVFFLLSLYNTLLSDGKYFLMLR